MDDRQYEALRGLMEGDVFDYSFNKVLMEYFAPDQILNLLIFVLIFLLIYAGVRKSEILSDFKRYFYVIPVFPLIFIFVLFSIDVYAQYQHSKEFRANNHFYWMVYPQVKKSKVALDSMNLELDRYDSIQELRSKTSNDSLLDLYHLKQLELFDKISEFAKQADGFGGYDADDELEELPPMRVQK